MPFFTSCTSRFHSASGRTSMAACASCRLEEVLGAVCVLHGDLAIRPQRLELMLQRTRRGHCVSKLIASTNLRFRASELMKIRIGRNEAGIMGGCKIWRLMIRVCHGVVSAGCVVGLIPYLPERNLPMFEKKYVAGPTQRPVSSDKS